MPAVLTGISSMATRQILAELTALFATNGGGSVSIESVGGVDAAKRIRAGEAFDFAVLASDALEQLERDGALVAGSITGFAQSPMAMAVRTGAARPVLEAEAIRTAMMGARAIGISTGPSGNHIKKLVADWGLEPELGARIVTAKPGVPVATLLASGEVDLGFQQLSELLGAPGIDIVGELPDAIQPHTVFAAAVCKVATHPEQARAFIAFLASERAADAKRRQGMTPA